MNFSFHKSELEEKGFSITPIFYSEKEILKLIKCIDDYFLISKKSNYAIRQLIRVIPEMEPFIFNKNLIHLIKEVVGSDYFLTKAIYFNKPKEANWFVPFHQDLSISVVEKHEVENYKNWTFKQQQIGVQPPLNILENIFTIRIHLDKTTKNNGALRIIPSSHNNGILKMDSIDWNAKKELVCNIVKGATMLMKPLVLHASNRTINTSQRRVIHLEFSNKELDFPIKWLEKKVVLQS